MQHVQIIKVGADDTLIVHTADLDDQTVEDLAGEMRRVLGHDRFLILDAGMTVEVAGTAPAAAASRAAPLNHHHWFSDRRLTFPSGVLILFESA